MNYRYIIFVSIFFQFFLLNSQEYTRTEIDSLIQFGSNNFKISGAYDEVVKWNIRCIEISKRHNYLEGEVQASIKVGNTLWIIGRYKESIRFLNLAADKSKNIKNPFLKGRIHQTYAQTYNSMGLYQQALLNNALALDFVKTNSNIAQKSAYISYLYGCRSVYYRNVELPDSSLVYLHKSLKISPKPINLSNLADHYLTYSKNINLDSAKYYLNRALFELENKNSTVYEHAAVNLAFGNYCTAIYDYPNAICYFNKVLGYAEAIKVPFMHINAYEALIKVYRIIEDREKELFYRQKYKSFNDSIYKLKNSAINASLDILLEKNQESHFATHKKRNTIYIWTVFSLILILVLLFFRYRRRSMLIAIREEENDLLKKKMNHEVDRVIKLAKSNDPAFSKKFQEVYPEFSEQLLNLDPALTTSEFILCAYIWLNFSSKEIANYTFVTHKTIQVKKYRLRKKLSISSDQDLYHFFKNFMGRNQNIDPLA